MVYGVTMQRTQLLLEPWQHDALRARAERAGISLSELVRRIVSAWLTPEEPTEDGPLLAMEGIGADASVTGRAHDEVLYTEPRRRRKPSK